MLALTFTDDFLVAVSASPPAVEYFDLKASSSDYCKAMILEMTLSLALLFLLLAFKNFLFCYDVRLA